jgi:hypothetical protein
VVVVQYTFTHKRYTEYRERTYVTIKNSGSVGRAPSLRVTYTLEFERTRWRSGCGHCPTNRKVAGSIPDGITKIFH